MAQCSICGDQGVKIEQRHIDNAATARQLYLDSMNPGEAAVDWAHALRISRKNVILDLRTSNYLADMEGALVQSGVHTLVFRQLLAPPMSPGPVWPGLPILEQIVGKCRQATARSRGWRGGDRSARAPRPRNRQMAVRPASKTAPRRTNIVARRLHAHGFAEIIHCAAHKTGL